MPLQLTAIVQDSRDFNDAIFAAAIYQKVTRVFHADSSHPAAAERKMVSPNSGHQNIGPFRRTRALGIGFDIVQCLLDQRLVAN